MITRVFAWFCLIVLVLATMLLLADPYDDEDVPTHFSRGY